MKIVPLFILLLVIENCSNKHTDIYKNEFVSFSNIEGIKIEKYYTPYSKECIYIQDKDSIQDFIVCAFSRNDSVKLENLFRANLDYIPEGYTVYSQDSIPVFGIYASRGIVKRSQNKITGKKLVVSSHKIDAAEKVIGIVSRVKKWPLSDEWKTRQREWKDSWRVYDR